MNIHIDEFITGDNIETLCDYIFNISNYISDNNYKEPTQNLIDKQINEINDLGANVIFVYGFVLHFVITGLQISSKLFLNSCVYFKPRTWSMVSIEPYVDQINTNLNPNPFFPPTIFFSSLL